MASPGSGANAGMQILSEFAAPSSHPPLTKELRVRLESMSRIGKVVVFKNKGGGGYRTTGTVEDEVYVMVNDYKHVIQKIRFADGVARDGSMHAYRTGYYTYDAAKKRIIWGQYTQFLTEKEYRALLGQARAKGWEVV